MDITSEILEQRLSSKEKEIEKLKDYMLNVLDNIRLVATSNNYDNGDVQRRKISELCTDARYKLIFDNKNELP